jgi:high frequency lysogenization protein
MAGVVQAAYVVESLAKNGKIDEVILAPLVHSLFQFSPDSTEAVYGSVSALTTGLLKLEKLLTGELNSTEPDTIRYTLALAVLERKAASRDDLLNIIHSRLEHLQYRQAHFDSDQWALAEAVSGIYQDTLSTLQFRIHVTGNASQLQNAHTSAQVRLALMAGFRSAMLWRQTGGRRWHLLTKRKRLLKAIEQLRSMASTQPPLAD